MATVFVSDGTHVLPGSHYAKFIGQWFHAAKAFCMGTFTHATITCTARGIIEVTDGRVDRSGVLVT